MDERVEKWLTDIKMAIEEIDSFTAASEKLNFNTYKTNLILKRAVERELEIIGEAVNRILKRDATALLSIPEAKSIVGLRNHIIHVYDNISDENIWAILVNHLPKLKEQVNALLNQIQ